MTESAENIRNQAPWAIEGSYVAMDTETKRLEEDIKVADTERTCTITRRDRLASAVNRWLVPVVLATAVALTVPATVNTDEAGAAQRSHPVFPLKDYDQGDYGPDMADTGCGPTSGAMVFGTLRNDPRLTPPVIGNELAPKYWTPGKSGTEEEGFYYLAHKYGVGIENTNLQEAKGVLWDGGLAIIHVDPGPWTGQGHYMGIKAVRSDGQFKLADPNNAPGRDTEKYWWSARELKAHGVDDVWTFMPSENMVRHMETMAGRLATGDIQIGQQNLSKFDSLN